jgi:hypothetical protein
MFDVFHCFFQVQIKQQDETSNDLRSAADRLVAIRLFVLEIAFPSEGNALRSLTFSSRTSRSN